MGSFRNNYMNDESSLKLNKGFEEFGNAVHSVVNWFIQFSEVSK